MRQVFKKIFDVKLWLEGKNMRVGVVSDSHGEIENLRKAARWLVDKQNVEVIVHLGDNYDDTSVLENLGVRIVKVPGVFSNYYQDANIPNVLLRLLMVERF